MQVLIGVSDGISVEVTDSVDFAKWVVTGYPPHHTRTSELWAGTVAVCCKVLEEMHSKSQL